MFPHTLKISKGKQLVLHNAHNNNYGNTYQVFLDLHTHYTDTVNGEVFAEYFLGICNEHISTWKDMHEYFIITLLMPGLNCLALIPLMIMF